LRAVYEWFKAFLPRLNEIKTYQLIHDKLNGGNVFCSVDRNKLFLLDFATLQYGYRAKDVTKAELDLLSSDSVLVRAFYDEYFSHFSGAVREEFEKLAIFYRVYYHLTRSALNLRRDYKSRTFRYNFKTSYYENFLHHWRVLYDLIAP